MRTAVYILGFIVLSKCGYAQKNRYNFAQSYFGVQTDVYFNDEGSSYLNPRIVVGGTHFWYHADFYISFSLASIGLGNESFNEFTPGVITGGRYLPFGLDQKKLKPLVGLQWLTPSFSVGNGSIWTKSKLGIELGASMAFKAMTIEVVANTINNPMANYPDSRTTNADFKLPNFGLSVALKKYFDFTASSGTESGKKYVEDAFDRYEENRALSTWTLGLGLSANVSLQPLSFADSAGFFTSSPDLDIYPDVALGYYFFEANLGARFSYRPVNIKQTAYGSNYELKQQRIDLEVYKFLFDYHGFVPFVGAGIGQSHTDFYYEDEGRVVADQSGWNTSYSIVFGWDIKPNKADWYTLRTNLRYVIDNGAKLGGFDISSPQLEINFIQFVLYPHRFKYRKP